MLLPETEVRTSAQVPSLRLKSLDPVNWTTWSFLSYLNIPAPPHVNSSLRPEAWVQLVVLSVGGAALWEEVRSLGCALAGEAGTVS